MFRIFFITGFFIITYSQENNPVQFSKNGDILSQCIENHEIFKNSYFKNLDIVKTVIDHAVEKFSQQKKSRNDIEVEVRNIFTTLEQEIPSSSKRHTPWKQLAKETILVIEDCFDKLKGNNHETSESNIQTNLVALPKFGNLLQDIDDLLDFILVDWPTSLQDMINTRDGQILIKRFATDAIIVLDRALNSVGNRNHFRVLLRTMWILRARQYFDARNQQFPYIRHRYTNDRKLMAEGDMNIFHDRSTQNFRDRNPPAQEALDKILNIHQITDSPGYGEYDIYSEYEMNGFTEADNYLETHIDQFYRILLYFAISRVRINDHNNILKKNQAILYDDEVYAKSLSTARQCIVNAMKKAQTEIVQTFMSRRVIEEDLILGLIFSIRNNPGTTTTTKISSTTQRYLETIIEDDEPIYEGNSNYDINGAVSIDSTSKISLTTQSYLKTSMEENKSSSDSIINCFDSSEKINSGYSTDDSNYVNSHQLPNFDDESRNMAEVLDYILVDWPRPLREMIENREDRDMLRSYAFKAIGLLNSALDDVTSNNYFRVQLRVLWMRRAHLYFDGRLSETQRYIPHRYTAERGLHTFGDLSLYYDRRFQKFSDRNPPVSQTSIQDLVNGYVRQSASFKRGVMTSAQYHIESHLDQFFRILIFFTELEYLGITTSDADIYEGRIPYELLSETSQAIVYDKEIYIDSFSGGIIYEEDLIMAFGEWFRYSFRNNVVDTNCSSITTSDTVSTTPRYPDSNFEKTECGKKKGRRNIARQSGTKLSSSKKGQQKTKTKHDETYGYIIYNGDYNQRLFAEDDSSTFLMKALHENLWSEFGYMSYEKYSAI